MLREGTFIKENPPTIGQFYVPKYKVDQWTPEERFMQSVLLGIEEQKNSLLSKLFGLMLRI